MNRQILIILLLSVFIALLGIGIIVPVMPDFATRLGASGTSLGLMIAVFSLTRGFFQPIVGSFSDRWGRKGFLVAGLFIYGLVGLILPRAESVANLIVIRAFHGFGSAMIGLVITVRTVINAVLQFPCGRLADKHDRMLLLTAGCLVISSIMVMVPLAAEFSQLLMLFAILGAGEALIWPVLGALAAEEGRLYGHGTMMGMFNLAMSSGIFIGSLAAGLVMDFIGLSWSFISIGITVLFLSLIAVSMIRTGTARRQPDFLPRS